MYLTQSLHRSLQQNPDRPATIYRDRVRTVAQSVDRIARLAAALSDLSVQAGDRVGILALNSDRYLEYFYAVPWMGAAVNPVNIRWSADRDRLLAGRFRHPCPFRRRRIRADDSHTARTVSESACSDLLR